MLDHFVKAQTLRLLDALAEEVHDLPSVAEERSPYALSRPAFVADAREALDLVKMQGEVVAEVERLVRELVAAASRGVLPPGAPAWGAVDVGAPDDSGAKRLDRAKDRLSVISRAQGRLEELLPVEQAAIIRQRLEGLIPELEMLLRPDAHLGEVLTFAFGDKVMSWVCGRSQQASAMVAQVEKLAPADLPILICGETGTGKELVARYIHSRSRRARGPFVALNCAAIPSELLESHLFGQRAGAFTSAREKPGFLDTADGGTFFLDEVSELMLDHQAKLLRFIEEREYIPVGGRRPRRADVRLLCATNRNLVDRVRQGAFRLDFYHRINDFVIQLPPLRERGEDLPLFIDFFLRKCAGELGRPVRLTEEARDKLHNYHFPGNIRELEKAVRRACILCEGGLIRSCDLYLESLHDGEGAADLRPVGRWLEGKRIARRNLIVPRLLAFLQAAGERWFSSREYARAVGLSDSQARVQLKLLSAADGPLEHNGSAKALSRYRLRQQKA